MRGQRRPQVVVHRRVIEGHRQHVEHGSDLAADDFDAGLGADDGEKFPMAWIAGPLRAILGLDFEDLGRLIAVDADDLSLTLVDEDLRAAGRPYSERL